MESGRIVKLLFATTEGLKYPSRLTYTAPKLEEQIGLHPALKASFSSLYGYTSDEGGIRHALMEEEKVDFNDAKFMLVVCSAFVSFVLSKTATMG